MKITVTKRKNEVAHSTPCGGDPPPRSVGPCGGDPPPRSVGPCGQPSPPPRCCRGSNPPPRRVDGCMLPTEAGGDANPEALQLRPPLS
jgi:hypothetical protein